MLLRAACDPALYSSTVRLLVLLTHDLTHDDYRRLKLWPLARRLGMKPHTIGSGLRVLVREGYLEQEITSLCKLYRLAPERQSIAIAEALDVTSPYAAPPLAPL